MSIKRKVYLARLRRTLSSSIRFKRNRLKSLLPTLYAALDIVAREARSMLSGVSL
jgi:hypothetical protein